MRIAKIKENDIANGDGIVVSVWTQGCSHRCKGCHNKSTWDFNGGRIFTTEDKDYIINIMNNNGIERDLAILGGEPLEECNLSRLSIFLSQFKVHYPNKKIYLWSGYTFEEIIKNKQMKEVIKCVDVLVDGKYDESLRDITLKLRGSSNQRIIDAQKSLKENKIILHNSIDK